LSFHEVTQPLYPYIKASVEPAPHPRFWFRFVNGDNPSLSSKTGAPECEKSPWMCFSEPHGKIRTHATAGGLRSTREPQSCGNALYLRQFPSYLGPRVRSRRLKHNISHSICENVRPHGHQNLAEWRN
jgi:hypothetical protein